MSQTHQGSCFCGAVRFEVSGAPAVMGFCHCQDCRAWLGAPVSAFSLWPPDSVRVTEGEAQLASFSKSPAAVRKYCSQCGGSVMTDHPGFGLVDVYTSLLPSFAFEPTLHVNYASKTLSMKDGLPKFSDLPKDFGGSGEMLPD